MKLDKNNGEKNANGTPTTNGGHLYYINIRELLKSTLKKRNRQKVHVSLNSLELKKVRAIIEILFIDRQKEQALSVCFRLRFVSSFCSDNRVVVYFSMMIRFRLCPVEILFKYCRIFAAFLNKLFRSKIGL